MNEKNTPAIAGQETDPLTLILGEIRGIAVRLEHVETRLEYLDRDVLKAIDAESIAVTDAEPEPEPRRVPSLAFTVDGRVLLSVAYVAGAHVEARETWTGLVLSESEASDVLDALGDGADCRSFTPAGC